MNISDKGIAVIGMSILSVSAFLLVLTTLIAVETLVKLL